MNVHAHSELKLSEYMHSYVHIIFFRGPDPPPTYRMGTAVQFHILKYSSKQELVDINPYPKIWEFPLLKF